MKSIDTHTMPVQVQLQLQYFSNNTYVFPFLITLPLYLSKGDSFFFHELNNKWVFAHRHVNAGCQRVNHCNTSDQVNMMIFKHPFLIECVQ